MTADASTRGVRTCYIREVFPAFGEKKILVHVKEPSVSRVRLPEPGPYIILNPTVEGSPEALQALGVDPNGLRFEITPALELIVGILPIVTPCQLLANVLTCEGFSRTPPIGEVFATIPIDPNAPATIELGEVVDNRLFTVAITGSTLGHYYPVKSRIESAG